MNLTPCIGIIGSQGVYGRWLRDFFHNRMHLEVLGYDPADSHSHSLQQVLDQADVLLFSVPIRQTPEIIAACVQHSAGRERGRLWMDITSLKAKPVAAMLASQASVVGLHPMTAPPKAPTLQGYMLVVCPARVDAAWQDWLQQFYNALGAQCVESTPQHHDQVMALVQAQAHALHLAQARVLRHYAPQLGSLDKLLPYRTTNFSLDTAVISRILSLNPAIYEDIQFCNPYSKEALDQLLQELQRLRKQLEENTPASRHFFRRYFLNDNRDAISKQTREEGNNRFEWLAYLLADLNQPRYITIYMPHDKPGSLSELLDIFTQHKINLLSLHSAHNAAGELYFRIGFEKQTPIEKLSAAIAIIQDRGIAQVRESDFYL